MWWCKLGGNGKACSSSAGPVGDPVSKDKVLKEERYLKLTFGLHANMHTHAHMPICTQKSMPVHIHRTTEVKHT